MDGLIFDEESHCYRLNGSVLPSVTTVIKEAGLSPHYGSNAVPARDRGAAVHKALELMDNALELDQSTIEEGWRPYLAAYQKFTKECCPIWRHVELRGYHKTLLYAGTIDRVGIVLGRDSVLDVKTGALLPWTALQAAAYAEMLPAPIGARLARWGLQLSNNGSYKLEEYKDRNDFSVFNAALTTYKWRLQNGLIGK